MPFDRKLHWGFPIAESRAKIAGDWLELAAVVMRALKSLSRPEHRWRRWRRRRRRAGGVEISSTDWPRSAACCVSACCHSGGGSSSHQALQPERSILSSSPLPSVRTPSSVGRCVLRMRLATAAAAVGRASGAAVAAAAGEAVRPSALRAPSLISCPKT